MDEDLYKMVEDTAQSSEFKDVFARMDTDEDLYFLKPFVMMMPDGATPMDDVINVTFNDAITFGIRAVATLGGATKQPVVEGRQVEEKQATLIESFIENLAYNIDDWLVNRDIDSMDAFLNEQICIRGRIAGRVCLRKKGEEFIPDVIPIDTRFLVYERGIKGLNWAATIMSRSKKAIKDEYGKDFTEDEAEVVDLWTPGEEIVFIAQEVVKRQKNPYGYPPFVIVKSPAGSMLQSTGARQHDGESIYWANRGLFPELNRTATIFQTINVASFAGATQFESSAGFGAKKPQKPPFGVGGVIPVEKGMGFKAYPYNDIKNAARLFYAILYTRIQQGGLSAIDYGNLTFPLSAVAIARLTGSRDQIFLPRLQAKAIFYQQLNKMMISQYKQLGKKVKLGEEGAQTEYKPKDLEGDYTIKFRFFTESKEQEIANFSVANAAQAFLSPATIRRNILKVTDPDAEEERMAIAQLEKIDEAVFLYNKCSQLIASDKNNTQAWITYYSLQRVLRARRQGPEVPTAEKPKELPEAPGGRQIIPLLGGGGGTTPEVGGEEEEIAKSEREEERIAEEGAEAKQGRV